MLPDEIGTEDALKGDVVNILCAGIDFEEGREYPNGMGFTDVILYVSFDMKANKISMLQIPRDTYIGETTTTGKINAVALQGKSDPPIAALATLVNQQFKLPVDYYVTIDIDAFDYSIAGGTGSPMLGGLLYDEAVDLLEGIAQLGEVICVDLVEVSPPYDDAAGTTCYLAARILADFLGFITKERERRGER